MMTKWCAVLACVALTALSGCDGSDFDYSADREAPPELLHEAGDGCLFITADTNGEVVAAALGCYEEDAWIQQAPDSGQAVVTKDLDDWAVEDRGEFFEQPKVDEDGDVTWGLPDELDP